MVLQGGRVCIAVPGNDANPLRGILLASDGGVSYIEPAAAVSANNDLAAARGEVQLSPLGFTFARVSVAVNAAISQGAIRGFMLVCWLGCHLSSIQRGN